MMREIREITVLGTGNMGPGVATLFAKNGFPVTVWAHSAGGRDKLLADCQTIAQDLSDNGLLSGEERSALADRIAVTEYIDAPSQQPSGRGAGSGIRPCCPLLESGPPGSAG